MPRRWVPAIPPSDAGAAVHGPLLLSQAPGIRAELDHVQAHAQPAGLMLHLRADGTRTQSTPRHLLDDPRADASSVGGGPAGSKPVLRVALNDLADQVQPKTSSIRTFEDTATGEARFTMEASYWIDEVPADGRVHLTISWPRAGLPEAAHTLVLALPSH
ncbi:hypothetical protein [Kineococcus esterisolvens]|uniref:hypothetical protein n=1 Tax=unclassified Kineococcus TaxID=2621656 RepID=UPI003D7CBAA1